MSTLLHVLFSAEYDYQTSRNNMWLDKASLSFIKKLLLDSYNCGEDDEFVLFKYNDKEFPRLISKKKAFWAITEELKKDFLPAHVDNIKWKFKYISEPINDDTKTLRDYNTQKFGDPYHTIELGDFPKRNNGEDIADETSSYTRIKFLGAFDVIVGIVAILIVVTLLYFLYERVLASNKTKFQERQHLKKKLTKRKKKKH